MSIQHRRAMRRLNKLPECPPIVRVWLLRALFDAGMIRKILAAPCFDSPGKLIRAFALEGQIDDNDPQARELVWNTLADLHRATVGRAIPAAPATLAGNVKRLGDLLELSVADRRVLEFLALLWSDERFRDILDDARDLTFTESARVIAKMLRLPASAVAASLGKDGVLTRAGLIEPQAGTLSITYKFPPPSEWIAERLVGQRSDPIEMLREAFRRAPPADLTEADFAHLQPTLDLLLAYLRRAGRKKKRGVNVLLYGPPGTGKSSLARAVASALGLPLYVISSENEAGNSNGGNERARSYRLAQAALARTDALIALDEAQDVLDAAGGAGLFRFLERGLSKGYMNELLETNPRPAFWLTNAIGTVDPAYLRRFDLVLEAPVPPRSQREKIIRAAAGPLLDDAQVATLAQSEDLAPALLTRAAAVVTDAGLAEAGPAVAGPAVRDLVHRTLVAQGHPGIRNTAPRASATPVYDPRFVNTDEDLTALADGLVRAKSGRLCLYGPPGTGKTEFVHWLAARLDRPVLERRGSDLLSRFIGGTERLIAEAFREATADGAVLLIDEADGLLADRRGAHVSWEVTQVNELLTQMESYTGVLAMCTNRFEGLDAAAIRRFDLKAEFRWLKPEQAWALLERHIAALSLAAPSPALRERLGQLTELAPGDFAAVARQHKFRPLASAEDFVAALQGEINAKRQGATRPVGFN